MASHSRFTDDIASTLVPTRSEIAVRTIDELRPEIFRFDQQTKFKEALTSAEELKSKELYEKYPPNFRDRNKKFVFRYINEEKKYSPSAEKSLLVTRWHPRLHRHLCGYLPSSLRMRFLPDVFTYEPSTDSPFAVEWHLNFANHDLFAYYHGPLLAQDELQVLECVELAALREYFLQAIKTISTQTTIVDPKTNSSVPTPILISNTERVIRLDTKKVYGNAFAHVSQRELAEACEYLPRRQAVNLIAIEAPSHGYGSYSGEQICFILTAAYGGFKAAKVLASKTYALNRGRSLTATASGVARFKTIIHTGWWGCGAYGNSRLMMLITQLLAAYWAGVDEIIFHVQSDNHQEQIKEAQRIVTGLLSERYVSEVIRKIENLNIQWDRSNHT